MELTNFEHFENIQLNELENIDGGLTILTTGFLIAATTGYIAGSLIGYFKK